MSRLRERTFQRICLIKPSSMGDVIHALPVLAGLRHRYPGARISWLLSTACMDLLSGHDALDEIIPFDRKRYGRIGRSASASAAFVGFLKGLRRRRFDLGIDLQGLFRSGFMARASGASTRIGPSNARELAGLFYTDRIDIPSMDEHAVDRYYRVAGLLGFEGFPVTFRLPVSADERTQAHALLRQHAVDPDHYALMFASARWETKVWPARHFADTADGLWKGHGLQTVVMGAPSDAPVGRQIMASARSGPAGIFDVSLRQMVALIDSARLVVGNESGPIHVAAALHRPLVVVIGPTSALRTGPYDRPGSVVRRDLDCAPCYLKRIAQCPHQHECLEQLPASRILEVCETVLAAPAPASTR